MWYELRKTGGSRCWRVGVVGKEGGNWPSLREVGCAKAWRKEKTDKDTELKKKENAKKMK
jgi:hypothetical protein